jgi:outer membrane protein assembly factor BamB
MGSKLRDIKQQLRERMHDPVRQTGQWLKSIVQGHFNYYAVSGNIDSRSVFRNRLIGQWWRANVYPLNAKTGAKLWSYATSGYRDSSPAVANGVVYDMSARKTATFTPLA